ncbi:hypothetical protein [Paenibacillus sp. FSL H8-0259]|uniref:hypothetical protein n=1 Tax=Paenibacillus sp. FSL H8-0259 TaxID=1920423 RepID=UPI00096D89DF|nr:hypothetical protein [Paenibacillus sp. FSL H8-0259]OMF31268.1 hypothetical protein BK132_07615 [Paenibacillus sp. FSL H8-0259]
MKKKRSFSVCMAAILLLGFSSISLGTVRLAAAESASEEITAAAAFIIPGFCRMLLASKL